MAAKREKIGNYCIEANKMYTNLVQNSMAPPSGFVQIQVAPPPGFVQNQVAPPPILPTPTPRLIFEPSLSSNPKIQLYVPNWNWTRAPKLGKWTKNIEDRVGQVK